MCTLVGQACKRGWILASTSDDPYTVRNHLVCGRGSPHAYVAVRVVTEDPGAAIPWNGMLTRGVNAAGLAYTYAYVHEPGNEAAPPQRWTEELLARCATVRDAIALVEGRRGGVLSGNYLMADATGDAAAVEVSRDALWVTREPSALACANLWEHLPARETVRYGSATARDRLTRAHSLAGTPWDEGAVFEVTRDHIDQGGDVQRAYGTSICNHGREEGTISAEVLVPRDRVLWWTYGWPCGVRRGYEQSGRAPWGRYVAFAVSRIMGEGELTTLDGHITPLGVRAVASVEPRPVEEPGDQGIRGGRPR